MTITITLINNIIVIITIILISIQPLINSIIIMIHITTIIVIEIP